MITRCLDDGGHKYRKAYDGRKGFKFMKIKKLVAMLATAAMAVGLVAVAPTEAKAATAETEIVLILDESISEIGGKAIALDIEKGDAGFTTDADSMGQIWGRTMYKFTQDSKNPNKYSITVKGSFEDNNKWMCMNILILNATTVSSESARVKSFNLYPHEISRDTYNNNAVIYVPVALGGNDWSKLTKMETTDPSAAKASDVMSMIDAIGTVAYTKECLAKIEAAEGAYAAFTGNKADVTNYATLTAARAKYDQLFAAAMGEVTVYVKNADWTNVKAYTHPENLGYGNWPGTAIKEDTNNKGWYVCKATIAKETKFEFSDGTTQSAGLMIDAKGTYWLTLSTKGSDGKYTVDNVTTTAPTGWVGSGNGGSGSTPTPTPTPTPEAPDTADVAPVVAMVAVAALAAVVVLKKRTVNE